MVVNKGKKSRKLRGSRTHGWGLTHRGKGNQGGSGRSGGGKKCHSIKQMFEIPHLGKSGFKRKGLSNYYESISLKNLTSKLTNYVEQKLVEKKGDVYIIDLSKLGYGKLLSQGNLKQKLEIKTKKISKKAQQKVEEKGGKVILENVSVETNPVQSS
ncbi:50S ribosomal protein L15 [Candidatus Woesearchaeota archaeon CG10_big_fil_rev_8_21_14_0_10_30_7]|nr:MAG: 50S ribosomal protein L15 [Candidatus Woesearchaeota archaeon CG10_big_fil_rev_8_21_14_0_10_30_7]